MTDISDKNTPKELAREEEHEPKLSLRRAPEPTNKQENEPALGVNASKVNERVQEPSEAAKTHAAAPISFPIPKAAEATSTLKQTTLAAKHDPSISIEEDADTSANTKLFIVDALAAAIAIAFTVLILQDSLPFLK